MIHYKDAITPMKADLTNLGFDHVVVVVDSGEITMQSGLVSMEVVLSSLCNGQHKKSTALATKSEMRSWPIKSDTNHLSTQSLLGHLPKTLSGFPQPWGLRIASTSPTM